ncbi:MAG: HNH endonuclease [Methanomassiliicoccales archaeon]|nr:MAG: HNH endonuclease [Methanomassiliicoccales archaeon]
MSVCRFAIPNNITSLCMKGTSRSIDGVATLVFHGEQEFIPLSCDAAMFKLCPFKEGPKGVRLTAQGTEECVHCGRTHIPGSLNSRLCKEWSLFIKAYEEMKKELPGKRKYYVAGTTEQVFSDDCDEFIRRHLWNKIKKAILRRDRYTCQECGRTHRERTEKDKGTIVLEVHHIVPRSLGGTDHPGNLKSLCKQCHRKYTDAIIELIRESSRAEKLLQEASFGQILLDDIDVDDLAFDD